LLKRNISVTNIADVCKSLLSTKRPFKVERFHVGRNMNNRRKLVSGLPFGLVALLITGSPAAQTTYPEKQIHMIAGFVPGGAVDIVARLLGQKLTQAWGKPVVVDNITGAGGSIAADRVSKATPDGYTLGLLNQAQIVINPILQSLTYDPVKDLLPVSLVTKTPHMLVVHNAVPVKSVKELVELAKSKPGGLTFASAGTGSSPHLAGELFKSVASVDIRHIPYKGTPAAIPDVIGGRVTMLFSPIVAVLPMVREGKLNALAVTSLRRSPVVPDMRTIAEAGYAGFEFTNWQGLFATAKTPVAIVRKLHLETVKVLALPEVRAKLADLGLEGIGNSPDEFATLIKSEIPKWAKVIKDAGIKAD
jgi:tripartite-type tricarboxylate transporter receptor subunit TctC